uniref:Uncharacterized protein n=1 Tax=Arundo donax TaxID=35708 RepID=A0A0A9GMJ3_ARUDO
MRFQLVFDSIFKSIDIADNIILLTESRIL